MPTFNDFRIQTRFSVLLMTLCLGFVLFGVTAYVTLEKLKVNGPLYQRIIQNKDLVADILPPPAYVLESYLVCLQLGRQPSSTPIEQLVSRLNDLRRDYDSRFRFWQGAQLEGPLVELLLVKSHEAVQAFYGVAFDELVPAVTRGEPQGIDAALQRLETHYARHRAVIDRVVELANARASADETQAKEADAAALRLLMTIFSLALGVSVLLMWLITRSVISPVSAAARAARTFATGDLRQTVQPQGKDETAQLLTALGDMRDNLSRLVLHARQSSESVAQASVQIASGNADLIDRTSHQASSLRQATSSMEALGVTVRHTADNAQRASALAQHAAEVAVHGRNVVAEVVGTMGAIQASSRRMADIVGLIDGLAFQTNLLSLNAAVEAARAGERGRGFAVVAGEVRQLAARSAEAAKEVRALIQSSDAQIGQGASRAGVAGQAMGDVVSEIQSLAALVHDISAASHEQRTGVAQLAVAVQQIDRSTQQNSVLVEQMASAAAGLRHEASDLVQQVSSFQVGDTVPGPQSRS